jgi:hypothetical protein
MNLFTTSFDDLVSYDDFLKILYKFGDIPVGNTYQEDCSPHRGYEQGLE